MTTRKLLTGVAAVAVLAAGAATFTAAADPAQADAGEPLSWRLSDVSAAQIGDLAAEGFDVADYRPDGSAIVIGDDAEADRLRDKGMSPEYLDTVYKSVPEATQAADTYYGGYHTVAAHEEHLDSVAAEHADLAKVYDIGDSWLKTQGEGGHDLKAICLTKIADSDCELSPDSAKPRFSIMAQIHSREIATGEVAWKWIDSLVDGYGSDDEITKLMDSTEMWVVPIANPDGVDVVASGGDEPLLHRKNVNDSDGDCGADMGIDLNRNSSFEWGDSGTDPCDETYQGASAGSEPEVQALEGWFRDIHPDQRGDGADDPAAADAHDVMITLHSYGNYIIVPWGYTEDQSPNDEQLRALGAKMAESNGYFVGTNGDTVGYSTSGTTDDFTYGTLGVASFTFEMGGDTGDCGGFLPVYECIDSTLWKENEGALMTAAEAAKAPYAG
ncbi:MAG: M14 family zinc carboxypeptidase [Stackebrandtia sp.]